MTIPLHAILYGVYIMQWGCDSDSTPQISIPRSVKEIQELFENDWPLDTEGRYRRIASTQTPDTRLWYNLGTQADFFASHRQNIPDRTMSLYRSRDNAPWNYGIQIIPNVEKDGSVNLILVEAFKCELENKIVACIAATNKFLQTSDDPIDTRTVPDVKSGVVQPEINGWLVGLRVTLAISRHGQKVTVSDQYIMHLEHG